jgi:putative transposase
MMVAFIDAHREAHGVESICTLLPIAPSTYFRRKAEQRDPTKRSARAQRDDELCVIIFRIWTENHQVYGPR